MKISLTNIPNENAIKIADEWNTYKTQILDRYNYLTKRVSFYDSEKSDIEHAIENLSFDAVIIAKMNKELKQILKDRRAVKEELCVVQAIAEYIKDKKVTVNTNKTYTSKTNVLDKYLSK